MFIIVSLSIIISLGNLDWPEYKQSISYLITLLMILERKYLNTNGVKIRFSSKLTKEIVKTYQRQLKVNEGRLLDRHNFFFWV